MTRPHPHPHPHPHQHQHRLTGTFSVSMQPQPWPEVDTPGITVGRLLLSKQYQGDLQATAQGQMLSAMTGVQGSAGYVAIEVVTGSLLGKTGSFALQHCGLMDRGTPTLSVTVVPDSGTGELEGLVGTLGIRRADGQHFYDFDCTLP